MNRIELRANGLNFAALRREPDEPADSVHSHESGEERRALLLHGFPDGPHSFEPVMERLAEAGYTCVAPWMRGYHPTEPAPRGDFGITKLAADAISLLDALGWERAMLVGHDWGAATGYAAASLAPHRLSRLVALSVPPSRIFFPNFLRHPKQFKRSWYIGLFQLPEVPEQMLGRDDLSFLEDLWGPVLERAGMDDAHLERVKESFRSPYTLQAALGYYRHMNPLRGPLGSTMRSLKLVARPIETSTLMIAGDRDPAIGLDTFDRPERAFVADNWQLEVLEDAGHFIQLERPERVAELILS